MGVEKLVLSQCGTTPSPLPLPPGSPAPPLPPPQLQRGEQEPHLLEDVLLIEEGAVLWKENAHLVGCPSSLRATQEQPALDWGQQSHYQPSLPQPIAGSSLVGPEAAFRSF